MDAEAEAAKTTLACAPISIFGASGYGQAMGSVVENGFYPHRLARVSAFIDDVLGGSGTTAGGVPILSFARWREAHASPAVLVSVGAPQARRATVERLRAAGAGFARLYDGLPAAFFPGVTIGSGSFIGPFTYVGPFTTIGAHAQIMSTCSIGHDVVVGDYCTICPSCTVSGYVVIEPGVFLGAGTTVVNGKAGRPLHIGAGAKISAGAVVTRAVPPGASLAGNPARPLRELARARAAT